MTKSKKVAPNPALNKLVIIHEADEEYFPNKPIWLIFDQSNGHKPSRRYVWWFDTKKQADEWSREHLKNEYAYDISKPVCMKKS